jgi:hypothetical protein
MMITAQIANHPIKKSHEQGVEITFWSGIIQDKVYNLITGVPDSYNECQVLQQCKFFKAGPDCQFLISRNNQFCAFDSWKNQLPLHRYDAPKWLKEQKF